MKSGPTLRLINPSTSPARLRMILPEEERMTTVGFDSAALAGICRRKQITPLRLFGAFARGEAGAESDIDLIADFSLPRSLFDLVRIETELSEALGRKMDLLTERSISLYIRQRIGDDLRVVYETR
jgi:predicted nucleotidyltransferase